MAFCSNCGKELATGSKFCSTCGSPVALSADSGTARKAVYEGIIHKCPNCGERLDSFMVACPACGYELRGAQTSSVVREFADRLIQITDEKRMINVIRSFSIPNTREDVLEFFILASSNYDSHIENQEISKAWLAKIEQCYQKAKLLMRNEPEYNEIQTLYNSIQQKLKRAKVRQIFIGTSKVGWSLASNLTVLAVKCIGVICAIAAFLKAIDIDRAGDNGVGYELLGGLLLIVSAALLLRKRVSAFEILFTGAGGILSFTLAKQLENGAGLQLIGVVVLVLVGIGLIKFLCGNKTNTSE